MWEKRKCLWCGRNMVYRLKTKNKKFYNINDKHNW